MKTLGDSFKFCPRCSTPNPLIEHERRLICRHCDFIFYFNTAAAAGAFLLYEDQLILCQRAIDPQKGLLDVPGGFIEPGETVEAGLRREIYEELEIKVGPLHYLGSAPNIYPYREVPYKTADHFFLGCLDSLEALSAQDDVASIQSVNPFTVNLADVAFPSTRFGLGLLQQFLKARPQRSR